MATLPDSQLVDGRCPLHGVLVEMDSACSVCMDEAHSGQQLRLGETLRISVALLRQVYDMPVHRSERVRLKAIEREPDGTAILYLERAE